MALRISLILAILAGLGVIGVSQFVLKPQVEGIIQKREENKKGWDTAEANLRKTRTTLKETETKLTFTEKSLEETKVQLTAMTAKADSEEKRANLRTKELTDTRATLKTAQDKLEQWRQIGLEPDQVKQLVASYRQTTNELTARIEEMRIFENRIQKLQRELAEIRGTNADPVVPATARGKVTVVDPKWDFVVLDFGSGKGLPQKGVMLVSRNGELVAKVRVMSVQEERSVANVMPGWKIKDIMEGDAVIPYLVGSSQ
jgi:hypothetical protein